MPNKYTIGQMSKLHHIPIKTLRYYDEIGLFTPYEIDVQTGYRYYTLEQFKKLDMIWYLKMQGVPLKEIKMKVEHSTLDEFLQVLKENQEATEEKIEELTQINNRLKSRIVELEATKEISVMGKPMLMTLPERRAIEVRQQISNLNELEHIIRSLKATTNHHTPIMIGRVGLMLSVEHLHGRKVTDYDGLFLLLEEHTEMKSNQIAIIPSGTYCSIYTRERRETETNYCEQLLTFIEEQGYEPDGPFLIRQLVDSFISHHPEERLKEIQIKIKMRNK